MLLPSLTCSSVVSWGRSMNANMMSQLVTDALIMAIWRRGRPDARLAKNFEKTIEGAQLHGSLWPAYSS